MNESLERCPNLDPLIHHRVGGLDGVDHLTHAERLAKGVLKSLHADLGYLAV